MAKAASAYQQCIELVGASAPDAADLYAAKSQCHLMLRHWADVVADATRALKISPKNVDALVSRGRAYQATGQEKKAKVDAQAAAASDSEGFVGRATSLAAAASDSEGFAGSARASLAAAAPDSEGFAGSARASSPEAAAVDSEASAGSGEKVSERRGVV